MTWKLWLDDQMNDPETPNRHTPIGFIGASSSQDAMDLISVLGLPEFIDFDHDLGDNNSATNDTAIVFLYLLNNSFPDGPIPAYHVHSENPVGKKNIESFMESWKKSLEQ